MGAHTQVKASADHTQVKASADHTAFPMGAHTLLVFSTAEGSLHSYNHCKKGPLRMKCTTMVKITEHAAVFEVE